jgi:hypothetical protein
VAAKNSGQAPHRRRFRDRTGETHGALTVLAYVGVSSSRNSIWECRCECGNTKTVVDQLLLASTQCTCKIERHGYSNGSHLNEYGIWQQMLNRCYRPATQSYPMYGGRGIRVCERWRESFKAFLQDMGERPSRNHTLDRINPDGDYEPDNCRWLPAELQATNRRSNLRLTVNGETLCVADWARRLGVSEFTLYTRKRNGWSDERTVLTPVKRRPNGR